MEAQLFHGKGVQYLDQEVLIGHPIPLEVLEHLLDVPVGHMLGSQLLRFLLVDVLTGRAVHAEAIVVVLTFLGDLSPCL